jgi:hypothetical protein
MAIILATISKLSTETEYEFKQRCCSELRDVADYSDNAEFLAIGRFAMTSDGLLEASCFWGLAYPELPADTCYIAGYSRAECRLNYLKTISGDKP